MDYAKELEQDEDVLYWTIYTKEDANEVLHRKLTEEMYCEIKRRLDFFGSDVDCERFSDIVKDVYRDISSSNGE